jgi:predicted SnoaL-like aldol condensation-catalyzing enzyme
MMIAIVCDGKNMWTKENNMRNFLLLLAAIGFTATASAQLPVMVNHDQPALLQSDDPQLAANKKIAYEFTRLVLRARDMDAARRLMAEDYMQHNPTISTGRAAFIEAFSRRPASEPLDMIEDLVTMVAEGDLVSLFFLRECEDPRNPGQTYTTTWFDMFRIENDLIAEHWDFGTIRGENNPPDCIR